jgi:hypothetical protein
MAMTTFTGPVRSLNGFMGATTSYIIGAGVTAASIDATGSYVILSSTNGGPTGAVTLTLPQVESGTFTTSSQPADPRYDGAQGVVFNEGAVTGTLKGYGTQPINGSVTGVEIPPSSIVQWGGNGNQAAPWVAVVNTLATPL